MVNKVKFKYTKTKQDSFEEIKRIVECDTLLAYPYFNKEFKIHNNVSDFQLGLVIIHKSKPKLFHSRKLIDAQKVIQ